MFVDVMKDVVKLLNQKKEYPVWLLSENKHERKVENLKAVDFSMIDEAAEEISEVELVFTAVGANNLSSLAPVIAEGINRKFRKNGSHVNIIICENLLGSAEILKEHIERLLSEPQKAYLKNNVGFVETVVSRMVAPVPEELRQEYPLLVTVEPYNILPVAKKSFKVEIPEVQGFFPVENILPYEELKLFVHNLTHAALAYTGFLAGHQFIWECMENGKIYKIMEGVSKEVREAIIKKHNFARKEVDDYIRDLFSRFRNRALSDTVNRVARDPMRKIGANDRIAGAMQLCLRQGIFPETVCFVMAACLCYNYTDDSRALVLQKELEEKGIDSVLKNISCIENERVIGQIKTIYREIKSDSGYFKST